MSVTPPKKWRCLTCFLQSGLLLRTARRQQDHREVRLVGFCGTMLQMTCPQLKDIIDILLLFYSVKLLIYGFLSQSLLANAVPHGLGIIVKYLMTEDRQKLLWIRNLQLVLSGLFSAHCNVWEFILCSRHSHRYSKYNIPFRRMIEWNLRC